ncbi:MAG: sigma-70 family RNA polymerase sigma factor [Acidobacteriota bacterium]|nr:sigma-70 family RNA polymerase sigma factor [Acidobacteriota bacterium]
MAEITELFAQMKAGNQQAASLVAEAVYGELHRLAARLMSRERLDHSLQPTVLVHEAYMALLHQPDKVWENRSHFFAVAAQSMRRILVDHARHVNMSKRGGGGRKLQLDAALAITDSHSAHLLAIDAALERLAQVDPRMARVVELRFFAGMTEDEIAEVLNISLRTVKRDWSFARTWLHAELASGEE